MVIDKCEHGHSSTGGQYMWTFTGLQSVWAWTSLVQQLMWMWTFWTVQTSLSGRHHEDGKVNIGIPLAQRMLGEVWLHLTWPSHTNNRLAAVIKHCYCKKKRALPDILVVEELLTNL